jgi:GNAT superfamily N-acetyltransferase
MFEKDNIKCLQEILMNSWPARHYYFLNGWILRFTDGVTARANSVFPFNYTGNLNTIDKDIKLVGKAYKAYKLPAIFTMPDFFEPSNLDIKLAAHGYKQLGCITYTMVIPVQELKVDTINKDFNYFFVFRRIKEISNFLAKFSKRGNEAQRVLEALTNRIIIPQKQFIIAKCENKIIGTLMGILDRQFLYIVDMLVHQDFRRKKVATSMIFKIIKEWGIPNGIKTIWLQVETENKEAMNLYSNLRFKKAFRYYYLEKVLDE